MISLSSLVPLLGLPPSAELSASLARALSPEAKAANIPEIKTYPDATYHNYYALGVSLCFRPASPSILVLDSIDIFNPPSPSPSSSSSTTSRSKPTYAPPPPLLLPFADPEVVLPPRKGEGEVRYPRPDLVVVRETTGREVVRALGEPSRKGAGGWVGVWLEWVVALRMGEGRVEVGVMLELSDPKSDGEEAKAKGVGGVWDRAAGWPWASIKVFRPTKK
ncbi:hypothetical protein CC85DRAFT_288304 [Cutaneotrichosporon oleaginosum]|uniref:Uncharacterized protein n=1 Tax=Cutaneotrichosporon oleaginosum TaxID=879819 RepID=A0A0J0XF17_9TREE|nr:uncharacterized protein CC85DRAFT_288304 [Cutaneotrichosporon oleaginosum]KLT39656.1 hypothetical protein CC85DRAFT_288304 [Cutaneotrichosporon oleaginosum]TXT07037.1 hypothetical protein COLE_06368 [Cutaneotrichosporon oleaginosum]